MTANNPPSPYALGSTDLEHERLIRQAARLAPCTERFFREAGIGTCQRVLDLGSGVGEVAMLLAQMSSGEVVGVERDPRSIARAKARVGEAGLHNVSFIQSDACEVTNNKPFDAAVGRFILMFLPDPVAVLRSVSQLVRPRGVLAFQEPLLGAYSCDFDALAPLVGRCLSDVRDLPTLRSKPEMGLALCRIFQEAGLAAPAVRMEIPLGDDSDFIRWMYDVICSLRPQIQQLNLSVEKLVTSRRC